MTSSVRVAVVTGGSGGIGREIALILARGRYRVFELSRTGDDLPGVVHIPCDISDPAQVEAAFRSVTGAAGRVDLLINNAGMGISGAVEFTSAEDAKRVFDVNFFGAFYAVRNAVPVMRQQRSGRIINVCSVAGDIPIPFQAFYSASKAALCALSQALGNELRPFGISVSAVLPGDTKTGFTAARKKEHAGDDVYEGRIGRSVSRMERDEQRGIPGAAAAKRIAGIGARRRVNPKYTLGAQYKLFAFLVRILPASLVRRVVSWMYAK